MCNVILTAWKKRIWLAATTPFLYKLTDIIGYKSFGLQTIVFLSFSLMLERRPGVFWNSAPISPMTTAWDCMSCRTEHVENRRLTTPV